MTGRTHRLYDCITGIGDGYVLDAQEMQPMKRDSAVPGLRRWSSLAAAVVLVIGIGAAAVRYLPHMGAGGDSLAPAASMPACSAPAAQAPACSEVPKESLTEDVHYSASTSALVPGMEIRFESGEVDVILTPEQADGYGMPKDLFAQIEGKDPVWLEFDGEAFVPSEEPTSYALYAYAPDLGIISDGASCYAVAVRYLP